MAGTWPRACFMALAAQVVQTGVYSWRARSLGINTMAACCCQAIDAAWLWVVKSINPPTFAPSTSTPIYDLVQCTHLPVCSSASPLPSSARHPPVAVLFLKQLLVLEHHFLATRSSPCSIRRSCPTPWAGVRIRIGTPAAWPACGGVMPTSGNAQMALPAACLHDPRGCWRRPVAHAAAGIPT